MNEFIDRLLLTSELGFSLSGLLRYRAAAAAAPATTTTTTTTANPGGTLPAPPDVLQAEAVDIVETPLEGAVTIPLLTGIVPQALRGVLYSTAAGPLSVVLFSTGSPALVLQFGFLLPATIAGGLLWQPGAPGDAVVVPYSLLGRRLAAAG